MEILNKLAPIVLFVYNRPLHTQKTLEALAQNTLAKDSILYIYVDGAKDDADEYTLQSIRKTRELIKREKWCKEVNIIEAEKNKGLANSIIEGVSEIINKYGKIIVLEDDIVTSPGFLNFMNDALALYEHEKKVMHISGFVPVTTGMDRLPETYFLEFSNCWGWATWQDAWAKMILDTNYLYNTMSTSHHLSKFTLNNSFDIFDQLKDNYNKKLNTWFVKWYTTIFINKGLSLFPKTSLVKNIGFDGSGVHCGDDGGLYNVDLAPSIEVRPIYLRENRYARNYFRRFYKYGRDSSIKQRILQSYRKSKKVLISNIKCTFIYKIYAKIRYNQ